MAYVVPENYIYEVHVDPTNAGNYIPMNIVLQKGDILVCRSDGDIVRLPVGEDGEVLTADSSSPLGVKWA